jgi:O-antigen/teichoic acid export membrane protein
LGDIYSALVNLSGASSLEAVLVGQFVNAATGGGGLVLIMVGRTGWDLTVYGGSLTLNLLLAFALCPRYGITGAAVANAVTFAVSNAARLLLVWHFVGIQPYDTRYLRLVPGVIMGGLVAWAASALMPGGDLVVLFVTAVAATTAFAAGLLAFGLMPYERRALARWARNSLAR